MIVLNFICILLAGSISAPCLLLFIEACAAAVAKPSRSEYPKKAQEKESREKEIRKDALYPTSLHRAILMPAHNEAAVISATLQTLQTQLTATDRLIVVADNCTDQTATLARQFGATVLERQDQQNRGKGYALDFGLRYLADDPPDVVVMIDADCQVQPGALDRISKVAIATQRPVQATYLMEQPTQPSPKQLVSTFAFKVKNLVRPLGMHQLGQPCFLTGTGMAFPWQSLTTVELASGNIVEDMKLGLDLAIAGTAPLLCADALVLGQQPQADKTEITQRTRWEHGHLKTLMAYGPKLLLAGLKQRRVGLIALAADLCIPPLALLAMLWGVVAIAVTLIALMGASWLPAMMLYGAGVALFSAILLAWFNFSRKELPLQKLLAVPFYILWKVPLYFKFLAQPEVRWVRTDRNS